MLARVLIAAAITLWGASAVHAQTAAATVQTGSSDIVLTLGYEVHRDRLHYGFENPSNFDTSFLVPHRFDQTYVADNQWFVAAVRYRVFGDQMATEFGATPRKTAFGSDLDTFFDPNDDVVVAGTKSDVSIHSLRVAQWSEATFWGMPWRVGYVYRRDTSEFHATERLVTHSNPASTTHTPINTHETTISEVHEFPIGVARELTLTPQWVIAAGADFSPIMIAKDTTILPEKYPGQDIAFSAKAAGLRARLNVTWQRRWPVTLTMQYGRTWSYRASKQFDRDVLSVGFGIGVVRAR